ncbi:VOC family protein [Vibrio sp. S4M6]|uniref:VOC family protein n=1 Tax=Vibrio sinus TaxID=2946865 RepID=UPI002029DDD1|nr:VOC family protein [Vibrio sinus]MCL9782409.1 VOC family protein [Vibrio sinus]
MVSILKIDHIGIRVRDKKQAIDFYEKLGFLLIVDTGFELGHPIMMKHESGVVLNLLGPSTEAVSNNILMDIKQKHSGYTHIAFKVESLSVLEKFLELNDIEISGRFKFKDMDSLFIRDPDRNVIEFDEYPGDDPASRLLSAGDDISTYGNHP